MIRLDNEVKEILVKLLEGQTRLEDKVNGIESKVSGLESEVRKNSIKLEAIERKIDVIAEVQTAHKEQNEKEHNEVIEPLRTKVDVIELAVKAISKDMKELKDKFDRVEKVTIQNTYDVAYLKQAK